MSVSFVVAGDTYVVPEPQAAILAENLRILAASELNDLVADAEPAAELGRDGDWRVEALELANSVEEMLVVESRRPLPLDGQSAAAAYCVLRLMVGAQSSAAAGLRDALGAPVTPSRPERDGRLRREARHLSRPELRELLVILFVLALLTFVAGEAWTGLWYILAPVIAALIGLRVATTRSTGRIAWSVASIIWWAVLLVPAAVLAVLVGLLVVSIF